MEEEEVEEVCPKQRPRHMRKSTKKQAKMSPKIDQTSPKNHEKSRLGRVLGRLGGGLGSILRPGAAPKAPKTEKGPKSSLNPRVLPIFWGPPKRQFSTFLRFLLTFFVVVFRRRVLEASDHNF